VRWGSFAAALLVVFLVQKSLVWVFGWDLHSVDLFLALALLCGLNAPGPDARLAAWVCGLARDLSDEPGVIGLHSLTLGLTGLLVVWMRESGGGAVWWTRLLSCLLAAWAGRFVYSLLSAMVAGAGSATAWTQIAESFWIALIASVLALMGMTLPSVLFGRRRGYRAARRW
jgi:hypothetical protein